MSAVYNRCIINARYLWERGRQKDALPCKERSVTLRYLPWQGVFAGVAEDKDPEREKAQVGPD